MGPLTGGDWVLVRPDGYIGAIGRFNEIGALENYLRKVGLETSGQRHA